MTKQGLYAQGRDIRYDLGVIAKMIKPGAKVLDIGCGDGELLEFLKKTKNVDARGLEISHSQVSKALIRGISVIQGDAENDLEFYPDRSFDYAILSQTIQATHNPKKILREMMRISEFAIISLPNFAHLRNRLYLLLYGSMPVNRIIPFEWYDTPNIHFCSIRDFQNLCKRLHLSIKEQVFLVNGRKVSGRIGDAIANLFAEYGIFLITSNDFAVTRQEEFAFGVNFKERFGLMKPHLSH